MDVAYVLRSWSEQHSEFIVGGNEAGMKLGGDVRAADAAVWRAEGAGERSGRARSVPPLLAVEVAGEDEEERVLGEKARWYLEHGVKLVWLVLPHTREVLVVSSAGTTRFGAGGHLPASELLPGLEPEVARFFARLER
jgi:Uma2 family endonuclease